jgi:Fungal fucose-specific lectin
MAPFNVDVDWEGVVVTLDEAELQKVLTEADVQSGLLAIAAAVTVAVAPLSVVLAAAAGYIQVNKAIVAAYDAGYGEFLTVPWEALASGNWQLVVPSTRYPAGLTKMADISAVSPAQGQVSVFYRGPKMTLLHRSFNGQNWTQEEDLGGALTTGPSAVATGQGHISVFYRGRDNALWFRSFDGQNWGKEQFQPAKLTSAPAAVSPAPGQITVFYRGDGNALWFRSFDGQNWGKEQFQPANITSSPAAASPSPNEIDCFYRGTDYELWDRDFANGKWGAEQKLAGIAT